MDTWPLHGHLLEAVQGPIFWAPKRYWEILGKGLGFLRILELTRSAMVLDESLSG